MRLIEQIEQFSADGDLVVLDVLEQGLGIMTEMAHGHGTGHARAAFQRVQRALEILHQRPVLRMAAPTGHRLLDDIEDIGRLFLEYLEQLGVDLLGVGRFLLRRHTGLRYDMRPRRTGGRWRGRRLGFRARLSGGLRCFLLPRFLRRHLGPGRGIVHGRGGGGGNFGMRLDLHQVHALPVDITGQIGEPPPQVTGGGGFAVQQIHQFGDDRFKTACQIQIRFVQRDIFTLERVQQFLDFRAGLEHDLQPQRTRIPLQGVHRAKKGLRYETGPTGFTTSRDLLPDAGEIALCFRGENLEQGTLEFRQISGDARGR